jgi:hypothetical protein
MKCTEENRRTVENEKASSLKTFAPCVERCYKRRVRVCVCVYIYIDANGSSERPWTPFYANCSMWISLFDQNFKILNWVVVARLRTGYWRCGKRQTGLEGQWVLTVKLVLTASKTLSSDCSLAYAPNRINLFGTDSNAAWPVRWQPSSGYVMPTAAMPSIRQLSYQVIWSLLCV